MSPDKVAQELSELRGVVNTEFGHITKRLDSHSESLKQVGSDIADIKARCTAHMTVDQVKEGFENKRAAQEEKANEKKAEENRNQRRFWRQAWFQLAIMILSCLLSSMVGGYVAAHGIPKLAIP